MRRDIQNNQDGPLSVWVLASEETNWGLYLTAHGYSLRYFKCAADFYCQYRLPADPAIHAVVLMGDLAENCRVAQQVRSRGDGAPLVAYAQLSVGAEIAALLSQGVDCVLRPDDAVDCVLAALRALAYRRANQEITTDAFSRSLVTPGSQHRIGPWQMVEQGWLLVHAGTAASLWLTPTERTLLLGLFEAPGYVLAHQVLLDSVMRIWPAYRHKGLLSQGCRDIFSRFRARAERAGLPRPPIESLRDYGYAWAF